MDWPVATVLTCKVEGESSAGGLDVSDIGPILPIRPDLSAAPRVKEFEVADICAPISGVVGLRVADHKYVSDAVEVREHPPTYAVRTYEIGANPPKMNPEL